MPLNIIHQITKLECLIILKIINKLTQINKHQSQAFIIIMTYFFLVQIAFIQAI